LNDKVARKRNQAQGAIRDRDRSKPGLRAGFVMTLGCCADGLDSRAAFAGDAKTILAASRANNP
jgi:hypothetical protein